MNDAYNDILSLQRLQDSIAKAAESGTLSDWHARELQSQVLKCVDHIQAAGFDVEAEVVDPLIDWGKSEVLAQWLRHPERDRAPYLAVFEVVGEIQRQFG